MTQQQQLLEEIKKRDAKNAALEIEIKLLRQKLDLLVKKVFGSSSEKLDDTQLSLFGLNQENVPGKSDASLNKEEAAPQPRRPAAKPKLKGIPEHLPVEEEVIDPVEVTLAPEQWRQIGEEVSEQLDYEPGRFFRRRIVRRRYVCRKDKEAAPVIAPLPAVLLERSQIAPGLLAQIVVSKYCDHLPLYRQEQIYARQYGVWLPRQKLERWVGVAAEWLRPIYQFIRTGVVTADYIQLDETPVRYLDPGNGTTKLGYLWTGSRPGDDVFYHWETGRGASCLGKIIPVDFRGTLQCDGYVAYRSFARHRKDIELAGCWAHARRKFHEALDQSPQVVGWLLNQIGHLYRIERELRDTQAGPSLRSSIRASESRMIYLRVRRVLDHFSLTGRFLPRSKMGEAISYTLSLWKMLGVYLEQGQVEIDNNLVENAIRPTALGKKNWLFIGSAEAGEQSAILFTIVECCRRRGIDPHAYLRDILKRLPNSTNFQIKDLTPEAWAKAQKVTPLQKAA